MNKLDKSIRNYAQQLFFIDIYTWRFHYGKAAILQYLLKLLKQNVYVHKKSFLSGWVFLGGRGWLALIFGFSGVCFQHINKLSS